MKKISVKIFYMVLLILLLASDKTVNHLNSGGKNVITTGIKGQVFISPVSPVNRKGIINKVPYEAFLKFISSDNETIKKIQTEEDGKFEIELNAGNYTIIPESIAKTGSYPIGKNKDISIKPGVITLVEIDFDSGIR